MIFDLSIGNVSFKSHVFFSITMVLILAQLGCKPSGPKIEERLERLETGAVSRRVMVVDGVREGKMTDYYPDGKLQAERWFKQGKQDGKTVVYYPSGGIKEVQYYLNGDQHGADTLWYENGQIQFTVFFQHNKKHGYLHKWSMDGALIFESKYAMDTLVEVKGQSISRESIDHRNTSDTIIKPKRQ